MATQNICEMPMREMKGEDGMPETKNGGQNTGTVSEPIVKWVVTWTLLGISLATGLATLIFVAQLEKTSHFPSSEARDKLEDVTPRTSSAVYTSERSDHEAGTPTNVASTDSSPPLTSPEATTIQLASTKQETPSTIAPEVSTAPTRVVIDDCRNASRANAKVWNGTGGVFDVSPGNTNDVYEVYCDVTTDSGGWTVFQRRMDGSVSFNRGWTEYVNGFGERDKEFWLGLEAIHQLTKNGAYELRVDLGDWDGNTAYATYGAFSLDDASTNYRINVGQYSGTAGDSLTYSSGIGFTTEDADHDMSGGNCAAGYGGPFWHKNCAYAALNGFYYVGGNAPSGKGVYWFRWKGFSYSLKFTEMKFRKKSTDE